MTWDSIQQLLRIIAQLVAGALVSKGIITEDLSTQLIGGVVSLSMVGWWVFWQRHRSDT